jgi:Chlorophyll A-B binding protein
MLTLGALSLTRFGPSRPLWPAQLGGGAAHLKGELPGDYGFDPLGLAAGEGRLSRMQEAELLHARYSAAAACQVQCSCSILGTVRAGTMQLLHAMYGFAARCLALHNAWL